MTGFDHSGGAAVALADTAAVEQLRSALVAWARARVGNVADAEDIVQGVLLKLVTSDDVRDPRAFLWRATRNAVTDYYRRRAAHRRRGVHVSADEHEVAAPDSLDESADRELILNCLTPFIDRLPEPYRAALLLTDFGDATQGEAARELGIGVSGMKSRVQRGRRKLKEDLLECCAIAVDGNNRVLAAEPHGDSCSCAPRDAESRESADRACG